MARITLITRHLGPEVLTMAKSLAAQQNEVLILTSKDNSIPPHFKVPIFTPFLKWNVLEVLRLFPRFFSQMPDVVHFIFSRPDDEPGVAHWLLAQMFQPVPRRVIASSFFHPPSKMNNHLNKFKLQEFLRNCHVVTHGAHGHLLQMRRLLPKLNVPVMEIIPPLAEIPSNIEAAPVSDTLRLVQSLGRYLVVPGTPEDFYSRAKKSELIFSEPLQILFLGSRKESRKADLSCFHLGETSPNDLFYVLQNSSGLLLAFSDLSVLELQQYSTWCSKTKTPILARPSQNKLSPGLVHDAKTGWILEDDEKSLRDLLLLNPQLKTNKKPDEEPSFNLVDSTTNTLNRLYYKAILLRS